jgi:hypothetical protein
MVRDEKYMYSRVTRKIFSLTNKCWFTEMNFWYTGLSIYADVDCGKGMVIKQIEKDMVSGLHELTNAYVQYLHVDWFRVTRKTNSVMANIYTCKACTLWNAQDRFWVTSKSYTLCVFRITCMTWTFCLQKEMQNSMQ